ncbi:MAG TPA: glycosyltransferase family 39 protein [Pyrinomonadaceae bacterium]|nr:glycosyltransferase family 39 protein [Pyrinomonadaceae bacterium]
MLNNKRRLIPLLVILTLSFAVRGLTAYFIREHLTDPGWFQFGSYAYFDRKAQDILDHKSSIFLIDDPAQTQAAIYPPGYPVWLALVYKLTGERSPASVQRVQWVLDSFSVLLLVAIASLAFNWQVGMATGFLAALSPLLALYGAVPMADAPTSWVVLGAVWLLLSALKRKNLLLALFAGILLGLSCWFRGNAILLPVFWVAALVLVQARWRERMLFSLAVVLGFVVLVTPLLIRNAVAFHVFTPTGLGAGTNLWEGIGETNRATEFGAVYGDAALLEQERKAVGVAAGEPFSLYYPDGVRRDRERARKAFAVISSHPVWYAGVMLRRMAGVLKFAGTPQRFYGSAGINVTSTKCLPESRQGGVVAVFVTGLGMVQSVLRYCALPLMLVGIGIGFKRDWRITTMLLSTILYYLVVGSSLHSEIRYGLPMQALLFVFAGVTVAEIATRITKLTGHTIGTAHS